MKLCRYDDNRLGVVLGNEVADVTSVLGALPTYGYPLPRHDVLIAPPSRSWSEPPSGFRSPRSSC